MVTFLCHQDLLWTINISTIEEWDCCKQVQIFNIYILSGFSLIIFFASFCQYVHGFCFSVCECCNNRLPLHAGTSKRTFRTCRWVITIINRSLMLSISMLESNEIQTNNDTTQPLQCSLCKSRTPHNLKRSSICVCVCARARSNETIQ